MKIVHSEEFNVESVCDAKSVVDMVSRLVEPIDLGALKNFTCQEFLRMGKTLYSPKDLNGKLRDLLVQDGWEKELKCPKIKADRKSIDEFCKLSPKEQAETKHKRSYVEIDFFKKCSVDSKDVRIGLEVQLGQYAFMTSDNIFKFPLFMKSGYIDLGVSLCPVSRVAKEMSNGIGYYEKSVNEVAYANVAHPLLILGFDE